MTHSGKLPTPSRAEGTKRGDGVSRAWEPGTCLVELVHRERGHWWGLKAWRRPVTVEMLPDTEGYRRNGLLLPSSYPAVSCPCLSLAEWSQKLGDPGNTVLRGPAPLTEPGRRLSKATMQTRAEAGQRMDLRANKRMTGMFP